MDKNLDFKPFNERPVSLLSVFFLSPTAFLTIWQVGTVFFSWNTQKLQTLRAKWSYKFLVKLLNFDFTSASHFSNNFAQEFLTWLKGEKSETDKRETVKLFNQWTSFSFIFIFFGRSTANRVQNRKTTKSFITREKISDPLFYREIRGTKSKFSS